MPTQGQTFDLNRGWYTPPSQGTSLTPSSSGTPIVSQTSSASSTQYVPVISTKINASGQTVYITSTGQEFSDATQARQTQAYLDASGASYRERPNANPQQAADAYNIHQQIESQRLAQSNKALIENLNKNVPQLSSPGGLTQPATMQGSQNYNYTPLPLINQTIKTAIIYGEKNLPTRQEILSNFRTTQVDQETINQLNLSKKDYAEQLVEGYRSIGTTAQRGADYINILAQESEYIPSGKLPIEKDFLNIKTYGKYYETTPYQQRYEQALETQEKRLYAKAPRGTLSSFVQGITSGGVQIASLGGEVFAESAQLGIDLRTGKGFSNKYPLVSGIAGGAVALITNPIQTTQSFTEEQIKLYNENPVKYLGIQIETFLATEGIIKGIGLAGKEAINASSNVFIPKVGFEELAQRNVVNLYEKGNLKALTITDVGARDVKELIGVAKDNPAKSYFENITGKTLVNNEGVVTRVMLTRTKTPIQRLTSSTDFQISQGFTDYEIGSNFSASVAPTGFPVKGLVEGNKVAYEFSLLPKKPLSYEPNIVLVKTEIGNVGGINSLIESVGKGKASVDLLKKYGYDLSKSPELMRQNIVKVESGVGKRVLQVRQAKVFNESNLSLELEKIKTTPSLNPKAVYPTVSELIGNQTEAEFTFVGSPAIRKVGLKGVAQKLTGKTSLTDFPLGGGSSKKFAVELYENLGEQKGLSKNLQNAIEKERKAFVDFSPYYERGYSEVQYVSPLEPRYLLSKLVSNLKYSSERQLKENYSPSYYKTSFKQGAVSYVDKSIRYSQKQPSRQDISIQQPKPQSSQSQVSTKQTSQRLTTASYSSTQPSSSQRINAQSQGSYSVFEQPKGYAKKKKDDEQKKEKKLLKGYKAFVRRKGKFVAVSEQVLPENRAYQSGVLKALNTLARSVTLRPAGYTDIEDIQQADFSKFRQKAPRSKITEMPVFVERTQFALSSKGEQSEIQAARKQYFKGDSKWAF